MCKRGLVRRLARPKQLCIRHRSLSSVHVGRPRLKLVQLRRRVSRRFREIVNFHWMQCFFGNVCISGASVFGSLACSVYPRSSHKVSRPIREAVPCPIFFMVPSLLDRATLVCAANRLRLRYVRMEWTTVGQNHVFTFFLLLYVFRLRMRFFTVISLVYPSSKLISMQG